MIIHDIDNQFSKRLRGFIEAIGVRLLNKIDAFRGQCAFYLCLKICEDKVIYRSLLYICLKLSAEGSLVSLLDFAQTVQELANYAFYFVKLENSVDGRPLWIEGENLRLLDLLLFLVNIQIHLII